MRKSVLVLSLFISFVGNVHANACRTQIVSSPLKSALTSPDPIGQLDRIVALGQGIVALGESVYKLVEKFRPVLNYSPITVVPLDPRTQKPVSPYALAGFSDPTIRTFRTICYNSLKNQVLKFEYSVWYSYGGNLDGKGKYLSSIIVVPSYVQLSPGWTLNSTMKVGGVTNHGTKKDPIAGVTLLVNYALSSTLGVVDKTDIIHIKANGEIKSAGQ